ncbi:hypothetical protein AB0P12_32695 [Streptomyces subrutilus]|uniref:Uncharacterized protein n=1 Tax=Streptomyces subrutilus TaxID=36818 RepID=A0A5P2UT33_9ACTN|nr:hypothetical protein [Streptomyces subrutilus]QEU82506.1 hypothetical protein CP968_33410 [Streptomyces subrutilus]WSJ28020.1 hypothetical protein OG479_01240 [Streptomyces subrutilus]GGZ81675.1 hypothetical protein GCM10010371_46580 [Streptomyces subrutilus]
MNRSHHFRVDHGAHSIAVNVGPGSAGEIELLVDGEVVAYAKEHAAGTTVLTGTLPSDPGRPFRVMVRQAHIVPSALWCSWEVDGTEQHMPDRAVG